MTRPKRVGRFDALLLAAIPVLLVVGCDDPGEPTGAIAEFIGSFVRSALAAFLL